MFTTAAEIQHLMDSQYDLHKENIKAYPVMIGIAIGLMYSTEPQSEAWNLLRDLVDSFTKITINPAVKEIQSFADLVKSFKPAENIVIINRDT